MYFSARRVAAFAPRRHFAAAPPEYSGKAVKAGSGKSVTGSDRHPSPAFGVYALETVTLIDCDSGEILIIPQRGRFAVSDHRERHFPQYTRLVA